MAKAALRVFLLLWLACGEAGGSDRQTTPAPAGYTRSPGRLETPETRRPPAPTPADPPAPAAKPGPLGPAPAAKSDRETSLILYLCVLMICVILVGFYGCRDEIWSRIRTHREPPRLPTNGAAVVLPAPSDDDLSGLPPLTHEEMEDLEGAFCLPGLVLQRHEGLVVKFRRAKPGKPNEDVASPPPAEVQDPLLQDQA